MADKDDSLVSLVLQGKREYEDALRQNASLKLKCHTLEMQCERLKEESEGLHKAVENFQEDCRQTTETFKSFQKALAELAEARKELAETYSALAQAQQNTIILRQRLATLEQKFQKQSKAAAEKQTAQEQDHRCRIEALEMMLNLQRVDQEAHLKALSIKHTEEIAALEERLTAEIALRESAEQTLDRERRAAQMAYLASSGSGVPDVVAKQKERICALKRDLSIVTKECASLRSQLGQLKGKGLK